MPTSAQFIKEYFPDAEAQRSNPANEEQWSGAVFCTLDGKRSQIGPNCTGVFEAWDKCLTNPAFVRAVVSKLQNEVNVKLSYFFTNVDKVSLLVTPSIPNPETLIELKSDVENRDPFTMARDW